MNIEIKPAKDLGEISKKKISEIFVDAFGKDLIFFSKDKTKLVRAFQHMFNLDVFYCALIDGEIAGITACTDGKVHSVFLNKRELKKHLGFYKGTLANIFLTREFHKPPMETGDKFASIEFVATSSAFRGKGVATAIMSYLLTLHEYDYYILEVADTNTDAVKLYEKLGFMEFKRVKQKFSKMAGINYRVYMKYEKEADRL